ncbi:MAG: hypothetical protein LBO69_04310 [Ignavibacteria bacterium]|jgi:protein-S-isoprenylcysteine O-methyltransferase Ste14|nr:hypothetical protein [Ignavibacteria bacterium]
MTKTKWIATIISVIVITTFSFIVFSIIYPDVSTERKILQGIGYPIFMFLTIVFISFIRQRKKTTSQNAKNN